MLVSRRLHLAPLTFFVRPLQRRREDLSLHPGAAIIGRRARASGLRLAAQLPTLPTGDVPGAIAPLTQQLDQRSQIVIGDIAQRRVMALRHKAQFFR